jgi:phosphoribosyl-ATP pyrophosphohydrolase
MKTEDHVERFQSMHHLRLETDRLKREVGESHPDYIVAARAYQKERAAWVEALHGRRPVAPDMFQDVLDFQGKFGLGVGQAPGLVDLGTRQLRIALMQEELNETVTAMVEGDLESIVDGLCDLIYVALGTAIEYGVDLRHPWREVQRANMEKEGGAKRADGKLLKPAGWRAPDISRAIRGIPRDTP